MKQVRAIAVTLAACCMGVLPASASMSLAPLATEEGTSWETGSSQQNTAGVWWFEIVHPPNSDDALAFQAVLGAAFNPALPLVKDDDSGAGSTSGAFNAATGATNNIVTWTSSFLPEYIAFKAGGAWYSVWDTAGAMFDGTNYTETINLGQAPQGSLSHATALGVPEPSSVLLWAGFAALGLYKVRRNRGLVTA